MRTDRRQFLAGAAGLGVASALPLSLAAAADAGPTRTIPSTGATVPTMGLGTWITFNVGRDPVLLGQCAEVMAAFVDEGGGMIDSSPMYGSSQNTIGYEPPHRAGPSLFPGAQCAGKVLSRRRCLINLGVALPGA